ncbi:MAG TPA: DNA alkylation repair protein [Gaiellaceae bacterium]|nr:DNA alkylation repair protein [Gaiellaceae bacterium]
MAREPERGVPDGPPAGAGADRHRGAGRARIAPAADIEAVLRDLGPRLDAAANEWTRAWWERYLKGAVPFRGAPMAEIRRVMHELWEDRELAALPAERQVEIALRLFVEPYSEDKLTGVLALAERLLGHLTLADVPRLARPFAEGDIDDWSTCDWYCVKVLGPFIERAPDPRAAAEAVAAWRSAESLWQRRAAAVAFVNLAPRADDVFPGLARLILDVCASNVRDPARFSQTGVGWVLRELSRADPEAVAGFVRDHRHEMSREALRAATARLRGD